MLYSQTESLCFGGVLGGLKDSDVWDSGIFAGEIRRRDSGAHLCQYLRVLGFRV